VKPRLALTMGDPAGVGPELLVAVTRMSAVLDAADLVLVISENAMRESLGLAEHDSPWRRDGIEIVDIGPPESRFAVGNISSEAGRLSAVCVDRAIDMTIAGETDAIVTAPISKEAWHRAGVDFPGHTEYLGYKTGTDDFGMFLVTRELRILHLTTHCALRDACDAVKRERILRMALLLNRALLDLGIENPSIAVAGLNPHCGESGAFGTEEIEEIAPAVADARAHGLRIEGPIVPDTVFARARSGEFDGVLAMYHDQGHIVAKTLAFQPGERGRLSDVHGINVTIGLPIIRTSVDHGTAFDIAGKGIASPASMVDAILLAARMALLRKAGSAT
jgi:4-phospho-D-threonate 3-dehydrogenase / 4-phospho-D-erythronate 3-dehydrogenase